MFAVVKAVLLEPLPFQEPHRLVTIQPDSGTRLSDRFVYAWRAQSRTVIDIPGWRDEQMIWTGSGEPREVFVDRTTPNFFGLLGTRPLIGRAFSNDLEGIVAADIARPRASMLLLAGFATAAVVLVTVGLCGVILFGVLQRTREIDVRTALGARRYDVLRLFMTRGLVVTGIGVAIGVGCSLALGRVAGTYGVSPQDPLSAAAATLIVVVVATVATYLPASRATRVDPVVALRRE